MTFYNCKYGIRGGKWHFPVDDLTREYMKEHSVRPFVEYEADEDAVYDEEYTIDLSTQNQLLHFLICFKTQEH